MTKTSKQSKHNIKTRGFIEIEFHCNACKHSRSQHAAVKRKESKDNNVSR